MSLWQRHAIFEKNSIILLIGILVVIAIGGLVEITPLFYLKSTIEKVDGVRPYTPLELAGRNIYVREGCYNCHSQMIRPLRDEVERYGHYSLAAESMVLHHPTDRRADQTVALAEDTTGHFRGATALISGQRDVLIELSRGGERMFRSQSRVFLQ